MWLETPQEELCRRLLTDVYQTLNRDFERGPAGADVQVGRLLLQSCHRNELSDEQKCFERFRKTLTDIKDPFIDQDVLDRKNRVRLTLVARRIDVALMVLEQGWNVPTGDLDNETFKEMVHRCSSTAMLSSLRVGRSRPRSPSAWRCTAPSWSRRCTPRCRTPSPDHLPRCNCNSLDRVVTDRLCAQYMNGFEELKKAAYDRCLEATTKTVLKVNGSLLSV